MFLLSVICYDFGLTTEFLVSLGFCFLTYKIMGVGLNDCQDSNHILHWVSSISPVQLKSRIQKQSSCKDPGYATYWTLTAVIQSL